MDKKHPKKVKDKKIRAFNATVQAVWGFERVLKKYIHSEESGGVWAYVRQMSERERHTAMAVQSDVDIMFEIAYNPQITAGLFLEFGGKTFKVVSVDPFEYNKTDLIVKAKEIAPPTYDEIEWGEYDD